MRPGGPSFLLEDHLDVSMFSFMIFVRKIHEGVFYMKKSNRIVTGGFAVTLAVYVIAAAVCFSDLPLSWQPDWLVQVVMFFQCVPMFFLQILLCGYAKVIWRLVVPIFTMLSVGIPFLHFADWHPMAWIFYGVWAGAAATGCVVGWLIWAISGRKQGQISED